MSNAPDLQNTDINSIINVPAMDRILKLVDAGTFFETDALVKVEGESAGVITGFGYISYKPVYIFSQDFTTNLGAVGRAHISKIRRLYDLAIKTGTPVIGIYDSAGARLVEGHETMSSFSRLIWATSTISGVVPQIALILGACGGSSAMAAGSADFIVMGPQGELFLTPPFNNKSKIDITSNEGAVLNGVAHISAKTEDEAIEETKRLIGYLPSNNLAPVPAFEFDFNEPIVFDDTDINGAFKNIIDFDSFLEIQKGFGNAALTGFATIMGHTCGFVVVSGDISSADCQKISHTVGVCDAFSIPVVTMLDTDGFLEENSAVSVIAASKLAHIYVEATCPKISVICKKAYGAVCIALAGRDSEDFIFAWSGASVSPLSPKTAAVFLNDDELKNSKDPIADRAELIENYEKTKATAIGAAGAGQIDRIIEPKDTRDTIIDALSMLESKRVSRLPKKHSTIF